MYLIFFSCYMQKSRQFLSPLLRLDWVCRMVVRIVQDTVIGSESESESESNIIPAYSNKSGSGNYRLLFYVGISIENGISD